MPPARPVAVKLAAPPETATVPSTFAPSLNVTVPVALAFEIVAVSVELPPNVIVGGAVATVVVVAASVTVTVMAALVDALKFASPL